MPENRPNVLLMICHDFGQHMGCYGWRTVRTPRLDAFAERGVRFARHFCTAPQCSPSRAAIMTGRYPHATGVLGLAHKAFAFSLHPQERHVAQILGAAGWETFAFGGQHATHEHARCGFGRFDRGGDCNQVAGKVTAFLRARAGGGGPFYCHVGFSEPHRPWLRNGVEPDETLGVELPGYVPDWPQSRAEFAALQGSCHAVDAAIGEVLDTLEATGLAANTIAIFTVDHGIAMPRAKCTLYDPGLETALMIRWPAGGIVGPAPFEAMTSNIDLLASLLDLLGLPVPANLHGRSFAPALRGEAYEPRTEIFAEKTYHTYFDPMRAIRTDRWKLIVNLENTPAVEWPTDIQRGPIACRLAAEAGPTHPPRELYDLQADRWEQDNLAGRPERAAVEADLAERLLRWMQRTADPLLTAPPPSATYRTRMAALLGG
jgi:arylsulfatase A-like enzyme